MSSDNIKYADFTKELCGEFDATTFTNENPEISLERAVQVQFGRTESMGLNPDHSVESSMGVLGRVSAHNFTKYENASVFQIPISLSKKDAFEEVERSSGFPSRPCFLIRTHFAVTFEKSSFDSVVSTIESVLQNISKYDFSFFASEAMV
jgi:hypothetical protein